MTDFSVQGSGESMLSQFLSDCPNVRLASSVLWGQGVHDFSENMEVLDRQRVAVQVLLRTGEIVYGHNTLLGHLDNVESVAGEQSVLLDAHILGSMTGMTGDEFRAVTASKIVQLSHGGTGISVESFRALVDFLDSYDGSTVFGCWDGSYGSGDVVPSAWWVQDILGVTIRSGDLPAGDLIALLNGSGFTVGRALFLGYRAAGLLASVQELVTRVSDTRYFYDVTGLGVRQESCFAVSGQQLPVSLRDVSPLQELVQCTLRDFVMVLENALSQPSSNPVFLFDEDGSARAYSQSSFLDYRLSAAVRSLSHAVIVAGAWVARVIQHMADSIEGSGIGVDVAWTVQYPKIATVYAQELRALYPVPAELITTSGGVEDMADGSLKAVVAVNAQLGVLEQLIKLHDTMVARARS